MRVSTIVLLVVLGGAGGASAQTLGVGAHAGVSLASATGGAAVNVEFAPQLVAGADLHLGIADSLTLRAGADFTRKELHLSDEVAGSPTVSYTLSYLSFPVSLRYELGAGAAEAYLSGGGTVGVLLAASQTLAAADTDIKSQLAGVELTADVGAGIAYRVSAHLSVALDLRFSIGLNNIASSAAAIEVNSWRMQTIQILVGSVYTFGDRPP